MNSQKAYQHPTIPGAILIVSPFGNITITNECAFKTTAMPAQGAEELSYGTDELILLDNAKNNAPNLLTMEAVQALQMFIQEKIEDTTI